MSIRARSVPPVLIGAFCLAACSLGRGTEPPAVAGAVDLDRYAGTWYELASYPTRFQRGCSETRAHYARRQDGRLSVRNECMRDGALDSIEGVAWVAGDDSAKLRVRFFWPFSAPYWILALDPEYRVALVGTPDRRYLWVLSRTPSVDPATWQELRELAAARGYDPDQLVRTPQRP